MKYKYIFAYKLISFIKFNIVSPATFVNKSYKLLTLKNVSRTSATSTQLIKTCLCETLELQVVPHCLANNYESVYHDLCDIWLIILVPSDYDRKNKESCQLGNVFRLICYKFAGHSVLKYISLLKVTS
jgi:hypothetical protein